MVSIRSDSFRSYHRRARIDSTLRRMPLALLAVGVTVFFGHAVVTAPPPTTASGTVSVAAVSPVAPTVSAAPGSTGAALSEGTTPAPAVDAPDAAAPTEQVEPLGAAAPPEPSRVAPVFAPVSDAALFSGGATAPPPGGAGTPTSGVSRTWDIDISLAGYQAEVDQCVWVRMDIGAVAPIVGAHNNCGGDLVLQMAVGDSVGLEGFGLDGDYIVTGDRDAYAGDVASEATAGLAADVLLQTCYYTTDGRERLITLQRVDAGA